MIDVCDPNLRYSCRRCAFTLIELLVVISIIGILIGLLLPALGAVRDNARTMKCTSNLRQMGVASHLFANETGKFPASRVDPPKPMMHFGISLTTIMTGKRVQYDDDGMPTGRNSEIFLCPEAQLPNSPDFHRYCHYSAHQVIMPRFIAGAWTGPHKTLDHISRINTSEIILIADGAQSDDETDLINMGNAAPAFWKTYGTAPAPHVRDTVANDPIEETGNDNTDRAGNRGWFRYRHRGETCVNAVFLDTHAATLKRGTPLYRNIYPN